MPFPVDISSGKHQPISLLLRAAMTILNAFRSLKVIDKDTLDMLKNIKLGDVDTIIQQDLGAASPAVLPTPELKIDLGLDRAKTAVPVAKD